MFTVRNLKKKTLHSDALKVDANILLREGREREPFVHKLVTVVTPVEKREREKEGPNVLYTISIPCAHSFENVMGTIHNTFCRSYFFFLTWFLFFFLFLLYLFLLCMSYVVSHKRIEEEEGRPTSYVGSVLRLSFFSGVHCYIHSREAEEG